jgi:hypothetical protein
MTYDELTETILNSTFADWLFDDMRGTYTLKSDLNIRIERRETSEGQAGFREPWANGHPDPNAERLYYDIFYGASFVKSFNLVGVDGCRAYLPLPTCGTTTVPKRDYLLARAVDHLGTVDEYLRRSKLTVA